MSAGLATPAMQIARPRLASMALLGAGAVLLVLLFQQEARAAVGVWMVSTAFGHCFLVLPIAAWLAWDRRAQAAAAPLRPMPWACLAVLPLAAVWLAAERVGIMEGRQLAAMAMLQVMAFAVLGRRLYWALAVPLLYLFFLVPFGGFLVPALQQFTARFVGAGLDALGIPNVVDAFLIEIPEGMFRVAEACAGLRFLIAAVAFGVLYACVIYRSPGRRLAFIAVSVIVPIIANGFRALGIVELGHLLGSAQAAEVDHVLYGWMFFTIVIVLLILAGLPFREDGAAPRPPQATAGTLGAAPAEGRGQWAAAGLAVLGALLLAGGGSAAAALLNLRADREAADQAAPALVRAIAVPPGCAEAAAPEGTRRLDCAGVSVAIAVQVFGTHASPAAVWGAERAATGEQTVEEPDIGQIALPGAIPDRWRVVVTSRPERIVATSLWLDGHATGGGLSARIAQAASSLWGSAWRPVLFIARAVPDQAGIDPQQQMRALKAVLSAQRVPGALEAAR